ncbi:MAG: hypothetical protein HZA51_16560 [Planctomycetes bacterium]|nr:hypothetical protein [Planctomycetota bacterium]
MYLGLFLSIWLGLSAVGRERMLRDPGTFWHTVVGDRILATAAVPTIDEYSATCGGQRWLAQQWLGEVLMALVHRIGGLDGLLAATAILLAMIYGGIGARLREAGLSPPVCIVLTMLALAASAYHFFPRPHLGTLAGISLCYSILCDVDSGHAPWTRLLVLPLVMVVWTNIHGGALGGVLTVLVVSGGWLAFSWFDVSRKKLTPRQVVVVGAMAGGCVAAVLVNPYGAALPALWIGLMGSDVLPRLMIEHAPLDLMSVDGAMVMLLAVAYGVMLIRAWRTERRVTWLVPLVWLGLAVSRVRHGPLFAITATLAMAEMAPFARLGSLVEELKREAVRRRFVMHGWAYPVVALLVALALQGAGLEVPVIGRGWARPPSEYWPTRTVDALASRARGGNTHVFNDMLFGGYLMYHAPEVPVYLDDRCELYGDAGLRNYARACADPAYFDAMALYEGIDTALVIVNTTLDGHLGRSPAWVKVAGDEASALYARVATGKLGG